ncbi:(deoxy)nucleoside triphosphate pyrophosphohydrolase [Aurantiacibacter sp. D1-12]|uniref:(deoxy)nucleoside triphosphate pyrophosphohydrolase n=1 Tax=Aurantiacibacter sp. D1-12 TaxID=2993658 RepID=UPI00237C9195|nr:(deoxy)nucleoside triphosphate pyrophosphohydrolase [Aurantiacibacter sp. D1-12]MDE1466528.1 (deoxy)nucleoside triphosphate pyrophosphohydrolase [Aurantiacibacter sp. D1-12]
MENIPTWLPVVALALCDGEGRILLQQRPDHKHHGGLWEFPGGKVETGESPQDALLREIGEELGIALAADQLRPTSFAEETGEKHIVLFLYTSREAVSEPVAHDGQAFGWFTHEEASQLPLAPMDRDLLARVSF